MPQLPQTPEFVDWFRQSSPYIHTHRGKTVVVCFGGEALEDPQFPNLIHDLALLHALGIRLVIIHGARPQIEQRLRARQARFEYVKGLRITDDQALACVKEAAGIVRVEIEALFSMGLSNSPMAGARIRIASGNFVTAKPLGVREGVDYQHTGEVRRIDIHAIRERLSHHAIVLISPLGYSPTGEVFNLSAADVAAQTAITLQADKLIFLSETAGVRNEQGHTISSLSPSALRNVLQRPSREPDEYRQQLEASLNASLNGVRRVHVLGRAIDGVLLHELFSREGVGTLISSENFEMIGQASIDDVGGILDLIAPLEREGTLVKRSRERLEMEIGSFTLVKRDGMIIACAALYPYGEMAELACFVVHPNYRNHGRGDQLLIHMEAKARYNGILSLFVLTTHASHWFRERGFHPAALEDLPMEKQALYNLQRNSKVFIKVLEPGPEV